MAILDKDPARRIEGRENFRAWMQELATRGAYLGMLDMQMMPAANVALDIGVHLELEIAHSRWLLGGCVPGGVRLQS